MNKVMKRTYSYAFLLPAAVIYLIIFILPTIMSFFFSLTRWTLFDWEFIGFDNFVTFFQEASLSIGFKNTFIYAVVTCLLKVVIGLLLGVLLTSKIRTRGYLRSVVFFPTLVSTIAVGIAFSMMMHPTLGLINKALEAIGIPAVDWLGNPDLALFSVALTDVWKGVGFATVIYIAGIMSIPEQYYEALQIDGGNAFQKFRHIIVPLSRSATNTVIIFAFIGGLRSFDLIWSMTRGGPGYATDVIASIIYKQYQAGFYGLATAGNVILFVFVALLAFPLNYFLTRKEVDL
ncbi:carbohydrate ABC transporter permease [Cohnella thailandensis]|uniref:Sugar ABC transporter permease n=1 Tax=Cohnella thailandensis TaxID=557557 RepID=A0A841T3I0_9BACL|nr:sugar ABC transporter permease [Cohnella thailandensis]MBB6636610.1 sugar ABC transporter permease [Cohnella thailandensis]MBP1973516.1 raffinose/stachyose/melibiose transport system permease protein [Cohnella thailandensis]